MNKQIDLCPANPKSKFEHILLYKGLQKRLKIPDGIKAF